MEFHAALKMMTQFLLIVEDMAQCTDKSSEESARNRKNAHVLKSYAFRHEVWKIIKFAFQMYNPARHAVEMLKDAIYVNHLLIQMLEEFSKGRVLTVKTQRTVMRKKKRQADAVGAEDSYEGSECEESEQEHAIERQFNFIGELTILVDYEVLRKYMLVLTTPSLREDVDMLRMFAGFCKRVMFQFKQPWVFFTLETLGLFDTYLKKQESNNTLLMGLRNDFGSSDKRLAITQ